MVWSLTSITGHQQKDLFLDNDLDEYIASFISADRGTSLVLVIKYLFSSVFPIRILSCFFQLSSIYIVLVSISLVFIFSSFCSHFSILSFSFNWFMLLIGSWSADHSLMIAYLLDAYFVFSLRDKQFQPLS